MLPRALVLYANGTNRDLEAARALEQAGAQPEIVPLTALRRGDKDWRAYQLLVLPGGFANGDALGAGKLLALDLSVYFADAVNEFVASGKPVIGICNGFQALVKAGLLQFTPTPLTPSPSLPHPYPSPIGRGGNDVTPNSSATGRGGNDVTSSLAPTGRGEMVEVGGATLAHNASAQFECHWVTLAAQSQKCVWTRGLDELMDCPVAHGEGRFTVADTGLLDAMRANDQIALRYVLTDGSPAAGTYPFNPNGSVDDIAGVCNSQGNVLGLMPHPEDHVFGWQHPQHARGVRGRLGLPLFVNGVRYARER